MFEEKIDELYCLTKKVHENTDADVIFRMNANSLYIFVSDKGYDANTKFDGSYSLYKNEMFKEETEQNYKLVKAHLERLLQERSSKVCI